MKRKPKIPEKTFEHITTHWQAMKNLAIRDRLKQIKEITFDIYNIYKKDKFSIAELTTFIEILQTCIQTGTLSSRYNILLNKIIAERLTLTGHDSIEIILKKNGKITVESGMIVIFDVAHKTTLGSSVNDQISDKTLLQQINHQKMMAFTTGCDGQFDVQLRVIAASEPLVSAAEFKCIKSSTQEAIIDCSSGHLVIDDLGAIFHEAEGLSQAIEPGYYKIKIFYFSIPNKVDSFYIVMCKTIETKTSELQKIEELYNV